MTVAARIIVAIAVLGLIWAGAWSLPLVVGLFGSFVVLRLASSERRRHQGV